MRKPKSEVGFGILIILGLTTMAASAASPSPIHSSKSTIKEEKTMEIKTKVQELTTPGGLKVWFVNTPSIPVVTLTVNFRNAGSKNDPTGMAGLTGFLSNMMHEGAGEYPVQEFKKLLRAKNIQFDTITSGDHFYLQFRSTKDTVDDLFHILSLVLFHLRFDKPSLDHIRQDIFTNLQQNLHSENMAAIDGFKREAFGKHPYGVVTQDQLTQLPTITKDAMASYMKAWFTQKNAQITVAGDIDSSILMKNLDLIFGKLALQPPKDGVPSVEPIALGDIHVIDMDIPQSVILFYQTGISRNHPDFYAAYILLKILADQAFESRLWNEIREKRGLVYGVGADLKWSSHAAYVVGKAATANKNVAQVIDLIRQEWAKIVQKGATAEELSFVKQQLIGSYPLGFTSTKQIVGLLDVYQTDGLGSEFISQRNGEIQKITLEDVNRVAKTLLQPNKLSFIVVGKPEGLNKKDVNKEKPQQKSEKTI
jgi:zinc protease